MARDCYAQVFKPVFNQARADGLSEAVAIAAAQAAMSDCLSQQSTQVPAVLPTTTVPATLVDAGPLSAGTDRSNLGNAANTPLPKDNS